MPGQTTFTKEMEQELALLADTLGFTREAALLYALRLVNSCVRDGLLTDAPERLWPQEAQDGIRSLRLTGTQGKVIAFRRKGRENGA